MRSTFSKARSRLKIASLTGDRAFIGESSRPIERPVDPCKRHRSREASSAMQALLQLLNNRSGEKYHVVGVGFGDKFHRLDGFHIGESKAKLG